MSGFTQELVDEIVTQARAHGLDPIAALAVIQVESDGRAFEKDGFTPIFLFEKHVFFRQLRAQAPSLLGRAQADGLAVPSWQGRSQYADQGSSVARMSLIERARAIDEELANRSASWGLGQIMGYHAPGIGYASATEMVQRMATGGIAAQAEALLRYIAANAALEQALRTRNWAEFARRYNGPQFAANRYDSRLAAAHGAWAARLRLPGSAAQPVSPSSMARSRAEIQNLQEHLARLGYSVGKQDGLFGPITSAALFAFQQRNNLPATGQPDDRTLLALPGGQPMPVGEERARTTEEDLRREGVEAVVASGQNRKAAVGVGLAGILGGLGAVPGIGQAVRDVVHGLQASAGSGASTDLAAVLGSALPWLGTSAGIPLAVVGAGLFVLRNVFAIADARVEDHREGFERNSPSRAVYAPVERWRG